MNLKNLKIGQTVIAGFDYTFCKIEGVDLEQGNLPDQLREMKKVKEWQKSAKVEHVGAKGKSGPVEIKKWLKEKKPKEYYVAFDENDFRKDDSIEVYYK